MTRVPSSGKKNLCPAVCMIIFLYIGSCDRGDPVRLHWEASVAPDRPGDHAASSQDAQNSLIHGLVEIMLSSLLLEYLPGRKLREIDTYWAPPTRCPKLTDHVLFGIMLSSLFLEYLLGRKLKRNWHLLCQDIVQNWLQNLAISKSGKGSFWNSESESEHELYRFPTEKRIVGLLIHHCIPFTVLFSIYIQD